jgi:hypothetical protein
MPQYFLTLPHDSAQEPTMESMQEMDPAALEEVFAAVEKFNNKLKDDGAWVFAGGLHPPSTATTVDATGDTPILTDGPYVEAKEYLGGFWIIEAQDLDAALEYAKLGSKALGGRIEVRPFQEVPPQDES